MAETRQTIQQDLSRGTNVSTSPYILGNQQSVLLLNLMLEEQGALQNRPGTTLETVSPDINPGSTPIRAIVKLFKFARTDGTVQSLAILLGQGGVKNKVYDWGTTPWTLIGTMGTQYVVPDILTFTNLALIADGYETPWFWDGTTFAQITSSGGTSPPAGAKHESLHQGYYWVWNTAQTSGGGAATNATATTAQGAPNADLTFTAVVAGIGGNGITVAYTAPNASEALQVIVSGRNIIVLLATDSGGIPTSTADDVLALLNADPVASTLITTVLAGVSGTGVLTAMPAVVLSGGTSAPSGSLDGPSALRSSDLNNPNSWPASNQIFVDKDDGDEGFGMGQFTIAETGISPTTSQILFKRFATYQMTGVFGSTSPPFAIQKIKSDMGCLSPRTIRFAPGFGLIRFAHRGFALFDGVDDKLISEEVRPLIFGSEIYAALDWERLEQGYATVVANPPLYLAAMPVLGFDGLTRVFVYDLIRKAWSIFDYPHAIATMFSDQHGIEVPHVMFGDFNEGGVRRTFAPTVEDSDDGTPISWQWQARPVGGGSPQSYGYFRRYVVKVTQVVEGQEITSIVIIGPDDTGTPRMSQKILIVPDNVGLGLGWGLQPWSTTPWGGFAANTELDLTCDISLIGTNARVILSGQGPIRVRGLEWHVKSKPLRRTSLNARQVRVS